jgi:hypothetical protein
MEKIKKLSEILLKLSKINRNVSEKDKYLQEFLTCKFCDKYFLDPVLLPCGNNLRNEHVKQKIEENDSLIYKCDFCNGNHEVPENG